MNDSRIVSVRHVVKPEVRKSLHHMHLGKSHCKDRDGTIRQGDRKQERKKKNKKTKERKKKQKNINVNININSASGYHILGRKDSTSHALIRIARQTLASTTSIVNSFQRDQSDLRSRSRSRADLFLAFLSLSFSEWDSAVGPGLLATIPELPALHGGAVTTTTDHHWSRPWQRRPPR